MFIAIRGAHFDGNDFVDEALEKGAVIILADHKRYQKKKNKKIIYVKNTISSLKKISENIIKEFKGNVIAITGSNGKTTTTNLVYKTLKNSSKTLKTTIMK